MRVYYGYSNGDREFLFVPGHFLLYTCITAPYLLYKVRHDEKTLRKLDTMVEDGNLGNVNDCFARRGRLGLFRQSVSWEIKVLDDPELDLGSQDLFIGNSNGSSNGKGNGDGYVKAGEVFDIVVRRHGLLRNKNGGNSNQWE